MGVSRYVPRFVLAALAVVASASALSGAERFSVVRPTDEAHKLLPKTCDVCHKGDKLNFILVTSSDPSGLDEAIRLLAAGAKNLDSAAVGGVGAAHVAVNPHTGSACLFCHVVEPQQGASINEMEFRTISGTTRGGEDQIGMCRLCHPNHKAENHAKIFKSASAAARDLASAGLSVPEAGVVCTTCHDMHDPLANVSSLKPRLRNFFKESKTANPHGIKFSCLACHPSDPQGNMAPRFVDPDPVKLCLRCHDQEHNSHRYGLKNTEKTYPMDFLAFPLGPEGTLSCSTCHDEPCRTKVAAKNKKMLRGGPYFRLKDFCEKCHPRGGKLAINPHNQIGSDGKPLPSTCIFCHMTDPWGGEYGPGNMAYKETSSELCLACHKYGGHPSRDHLVEIGDKKHEKLKEYESRHKVKLPLGENGMISCFSCHNPHGKGVLSGVEALGAGEAKFLRIPSFAEICAPCHARMD